MKCVLSHGRAWKRVIISLRTLSPFRLSSRTHFMPTCQQEPEWRDKKERKSKPSKITENVTRRSESLINPEKKNVTAKAKKESSKFKSHPPSTVSQRLTPAPKWDGPGLTTPRDWSVSDGNPWRPLTSSGKNHRNLLVVVFVPPCSLASLSDIY